MRNVLFTCMCLFIAIAPGRAAETVTTGSLVREMADLARLAEFPEQPYRTIQFSSYDRRSEVPNTPEWYANSDGFGGEPIPGFLSVVKPADSEGIGEYLMAEVKGPGAIIRTWTAAIGGELQVFLDGSEKPIYDGQADVFLLDKYAHYCGGLGLSSEGAGDSFHQRNADYFPMPFGKSCRIIWKGKLRELHFYQIQIREYRVPLEGGVQTFQPDDLKTYTDDIARTISIFQNPAKALDGIPVKETIAVNATVNPGEQVEAAKSDGGSAIIRSLTLKAGAADVRIALRQTILRIRFDGAPVPQVEAPVGDFFGAAPGVNPYETLPMTVKPDGTMLSRFVMPFANSMSLSFDNRGEQVVKLVGEIVVSPYNWRPERSMHFRARWRVNHDLLAAPGDGVFDLPFLVAHGQGVYVGTAVMLMNPSPVPTAYGNWWGEGDEKVFVDGETFPSTFGTGSEDYFNYAWSSCELFEHPYCAQPIVTGPDTRGYLSNCRWHILDALPFEREVSFYMELFSHRKTPGLSYARIAYHYAGGGMRDDCVPIMDSDARLAPLPARWAPVGSHGSQGAIFYQAESLKAEGDGEIKVVEGELWSGGKRLEWRPIKDGDKLSLPLNVERAGRYAIVLTAAMAPDSGSFRVSCDGTPLEREGDGATADLRSPYQTMLRNIIWKPIDLKPGTHATVLEAVNGSSGSMIGLDFLWLHPRR